MKNPIETESLIPGEPGDDAYPWYVGVKEDGKLYLFYEDVEQELELGNAVYTATEVRAERERLNSEIARLKESEAYWKDRWNKAQDELDQYRTEEFLKNANNSFELNFNDMLEDLAKAGFAFKEPRHSDLDPKYHSVTLDHGLIQINTWAIESGFSYHIHAKFGNSSGLGTGRVTNEDEMRELIISVTESNKVVLSHPESK